MKLGVQICAGLHYAHDQRIIHRDIKTGNLFFTRGKVVKIMDFGLAKMVEEVRAAATVIGGTPYYMAPEQALGRERWTTARISTRFGRHPLRAAHRHASPSQDGDVNYHHRHTPPPDVRGTARRGAPRRAGRADPRADGQGAGRPPRERGPRPRPPPAHAGGAPERPELQRLTPAAVGAARAPRRVRRRSGGSERPNQRRS